MTTSKSLLSTLLVTFERLRGAVRYVTREKLGLFDLTNCYAGLGAKKELLVGIKRLVRDWQSLMRFVRRWVKNMCPTPLPR